VTTHAKTFPLPRRHNNEPLGLLTKCFPSVLTPYFRLVAAVSAGGRERGRRGESAVDEERARLTRREEGERGESAVDEERARLTRREEGERGEERENEGR